MGKCSQKCTQSLRDNSIRDCKKKDKQRMHAGMYVEPPRAQRRVEGCSALDTWENQYSRWIENPRANAKPGPHPDSKHAWNVHPEMFDFALNDEDDDF